MTTTTEETAVCQCGHDDVTHALRLRRVGNVLGAHWTECLASLADWECGCAMFSAPVTDAPALKTCERCGARVHNLSADGQCLVCIALAADPFAGIPQPDDNPW